MTKRTRAILAVLIAVSTIPVVALFFMSRGSASKLDCGPISFTPPGTGIKPEIVSEMPTVQPTLTKLVEVALSGLEWASATVSAPRSIPFEQSETVELNVSPTLSVAELENQVRSKVLERSTARREALGNEAPANELDNTRVESAKIRISDRMEAQLVGENLSVRAITPEIQAVVSTVPTRWAWTVVPTSSGSASLHVTLSARIDVNGHDTPLVLRTFDRYIEVNVSVTQHVALFVGNHWQWLWATLVVPAFGFVWNRRRKRLREPSENVA